MYRNQLVVPSFEKQANKKKEKDKKENNQEENTQAGNQIIQPQQQIPQEQIPQQIVQPQQMPVQTGNEQMIAPSQQTMPNQPVAQQPQMVQAQQTGFNITPQVIGGAGIGATVGGTLGAWLFKDPAHKHIAAQQSKIDAIDNAISDILSSQVEINEAGKVVNNKETGWLKRWGYKSQYGNEAERQKSLKQLEQEKNNLLFEREKALQAIEEIKQTPSKWGKIGRFAGIAGSLIGGAGIGAALANKFFNKPTPQANLNNPNNPLAPYLQQGNMISGGYPMTQDMMGYPKMASLKPRYKIASICQRNQ